MKNLFLGLFLLLFLSCQEQGKETTLSPEKQQISKTLNTYFTALTELKQFNGVIMAYHSDTLLLHKAYNLDESPSSSIYVTAEHQFDIHSVSKLMGRYLIEILEAEGRLSKSQTLDTYYPDFPRGNEISLQMLLDHESGLPREPDDFDGDKRDLSREEIVTLCLRQQLLFEPGEDSQYSNVGYELIYDIIAQENEKSFSQCLIDQVFDPLEMDASGAHFFTETKRMRQLAKNHVQAEPVPVQVPNILDEDFRTSHIFSTANDLHLFLNKLKSDPLAKGLQTENGIYAKDGGSDGIRAQVYLDTNNNFQFVLLSNYDGMPFLKTIQDFVAMMSSEPVEIPKELNRTSIELEASQMTKFAGAYAFADFGGLVLNVAIQEGQLIVIQDGEVIARMKAESETVFFEDPKVPESFEFIPNEAGSFDVLMGWKGIKLLGVRQ